MQVSAARMKARRTLIAVLLYIFGAATTFSYESPADAGETASSFVLPIWIALIFAPVAFALPLSEIAVDWALNRQGKRHESRFHAIAAFLGRTLIPGATLGLVASLPFTYPYYVCEAILLAAFSAGLLCVGRLRKRLLK